MTSESDPSRSFATGRLPGGCEVVLCNPSRYAEVAVRRLRPWLLRLLQEIAPAARGLGVRFVTDLEMRRFNLDFRCRDHPTDVLSFPGELDSEEAYLGDIVVSVPAARRQAATAGHDVQRELRILLVHGILHCLGHDHERDDGTMERREAALRREWIGDV